MSECRVNHTKADLKRKYESQESFLPAEIKSLFSPFFARDHAQELLNEVFHLLKKYDLASAEEQSARNNRLLLVLKNV
ncbi:hypothetical protein [Neobacillus jeddahensis]|uniref:hypothetical protein n=1 Tax=Neobacillus jeddahensis TaxID=1461580 RepID=UPI00058E7711|nr:hypothetical protein [Neobacillus jeddahensis]